MRVMSGILEAAGPMWSEELFLLDYIIVHFYDVLHVGGLSFIVRTCMKRIVEPEGCRFTFVIIKAKLRFQHSLLIMNTHLLFYK